VYLTISESISLPLKITHTHRNIQSQCRGRRTNFREMRVQLPISTRKAMKSSAGISLTHPARKEAPGCTRVPSRRCFFARIGIYIGIQYGVADNNAQFYTEQDWRPNHPPRRTSGWASGQDEIRLEVSKPAPRACERVYVKRGTRESRKRARERRVHYDPNRTERTYLLYVAHRWRRVRV